MELIGINNRGLGMPKEIVHPGARRGLFSSQAAPPLGENAAEAPSNERVSVPSSIGETSTPSPSPSSRRKAREPNVPNQNKHKRMKHMDIMDSCFKHTEISRQSMVIVKAHYTEAWPSWKAIRKEQRESMWTHLKEARLGRNLSHIELYDTTHMHDGQYVDDRAKDVSEKYKAIVHEKHGHETDSQPSFDAEAWIEGSGGPKKDRLLGFSTTVDPHKSLGSPCSSSSSRCSSRFTTETSNLQTTVNALKLELKELREGRVRLETTMRRLETTMNSLESAMSAMSKFLSTHGSSCSSGKEAAPASTSHPIGNTDGEDTDESSESEDDDGLE